MINRIFFQKIETNVKKKFTKGKLAIMLVCMIVGFIIIFRIDVEPNTLYTEDDVIWGYLVICGLILMFSTFKSMNESEKIKKYNNSWATTADGRIYMIEVLDNGEGLVLGGIAVGETLDKFGNNKSSAGSILGMAIGTNATYNTLIRSIEYMSNPNLIAKIIENVNNISGVDVREILKVYSIEEKNNYYKIVCDYKTIKKNLEVSRREIMVSKTINQVNELILELRRYM